MKTIKQKDGQINWIYTQYENSSTWWCEREDSKYQVPFHLVRENNRGWTLNTYSLTGRETQIFLSRGEWEMIEE